jgi:hypothetical protein
LAEEPILKGTIMEYPLGLLYNPKGDNVEQIKFDSGNHFDWKIPLPRMDLNSER